LLGRLGIMLVNIAIVFGHYVIIASALNLQYGNAGIPNMSSNVSVACGAYVVSSFVLRICMWIAGRAGLAFRPDWVYDNPYNVSVLNAFLKARPFLSLSLLLLSIALALLFGSLLGWGLAAVSGRLRSVKLMIMLFVVSDAGGLIAANNRYIAGGALGAFIPNFLSWYQGEQMVIVALSTLAVGLACFTVIRAMLNSPLGRLMRAMRENEVTLASTGKGVVAIRRDVMIFGSGMMAVSGVLLGFYYCFVQFQFYTRVSYTFWPWLMITIGGLGNNAGAYLGVLICVSIVRGIAVAHDLILPGIIHTRWLGLIGYLENMLLGALLLLFFIFKPKGLVPERGLSIPGINYRGLIRGDKERPG